MAVKVTITCVHCGKAFRYTIPSGGRGTINAQHSAGNGGGSSACGKSTRVHYHNGIVEGTDV